MTIFSSNWCVEYCGRTCLSLLTQRKKLFYTAFVCSFVDPTYLWCNIAGDPFGNCRDRKVMITEGMEAARKSNLEATMRSAIANLILQMWWHFRIRLVGSQHYNMMVFGSELSHVETDLSQPLKTEHRTEESYANFLWKAYLYLRKWLKILDV